MNARFDFVSPPSASASTASCDFGCCARYRASVDAPPGMIAELAVWAERSGEILYQLTRDALRAAFVARR